MNKVVNILTGIIFGLAPMFGAAFMYMLMYFFLYNIWGLIVSITSILLALWLGYLNFKSVQEVGLISFLSKIHSSPELDDDSETD
jgi:hypothetical protein